jgi:hypothetical protein
MVKILEVIDSLNDENVLEIKEQLKTEAEALDKSNKQLYSRAKTAEGFERNSEGKWVKKPESVKEPEKPESNKLQSDEPDYAKLAFLEGKGIKHPDDQKLVQEEANRLKLSLTDILGMEHIKAKLKNASDQREAEAGMPQGGGQPGSGSKNSVDYWLDKKDKDGHYVTPPDPETHLKVINERISRQKKNKMFADDMY